MLNKILIISTFLFYIVKVQSCKTNQKNERLLDFISIKKTTRLPIISDQFELKYLYDTSYIIYYKQYVMVTTIVNYGIANKDTSVNFDKTEYFVYRLGDSDGFYYKSLAEKYDRKINVDTFLAKSDFSNHDFYIDTTLINISLIKSINKNEIVENFVSKNTNALGCYDTGYFYFTKDFPDKVYNLSKKFQTNEGLKLTRFRFVPGCLINKIKINKENKSPRFDYWIKRDTIQNITEVLTFIDNFSKKDLN